MGAGKSTFARALLEALGVDRPPEGSPTFAIAHEYRMTREGSLALSTPRAEAAVIHLDLYRLRSEGELEEAGVTAYFWERSALVIVEWLSLFESFRAAVLRPSEGRAVWQVDLAFDVGCESRRTLRIARI